MARELDPDVGRSAAGEPDAAEALVRDPELEALQRKHRGFVFPATVITLVWYMALIFAAAYAHDFMAIRVTGAITVGYLFALSQFLMAFVVAWVYSRWAARRMDPLSADLREKLHHQQIKEVAE